MAKAIKYRGRKVSISQQCFNNHTELDDMKDADMIRVHNAGDVSEIGFDSDFDTYDLLDSSVSEKAKDVGELSDTTIEVARNDQDNGQRALRMAGKPENCNDYLIKIENADDSIDWLRGPISGPQNQGGGRDDFDLDEYTMGPSQWIHEYGDAEGGCEEYCDLQEAMDDAEDEVYEIPDRETVEEAAEDSSS